MKEAFAFGAVLILITVVLSPLPVVAGLVRPQQNQSASSTSQLPVGMPVETSLNSTGYFLAELVEQTAPFRALAGGIPYGIRPYQSFGCEWGATIPSEEIITFFSPNGLLTIEVDVITSPAPGTTSVNQSQIAYIHEWPAVNSTRGVSLLLDLSLDLNGTSSPNIAPSFTPIIVSMDWGNSTGDQVFYG